MGLNDILGGTTSQNGGSEKPPSAGRGRAPSWPDGPARRGPNPTSRLCYSCLAPDIGVFSTMPGDYSRVIPTRPPLLSSASSSLIASSRWVRGPRAGRIQASIAAMAQLATPIHRTCV